MDSPKNFAVELCNKLVAHSVISEQEAQQLQKAFEESSKRQFNDFLLEEELVSREDLLRALSEIYQVPSFDVVGYFFKHDLVRLFPKGVMLRNGFIPLEVDQNMLIVVVSDPRDENILSAIGEFVSYDVRLQVGIRPDIEDAVKEYYDQALSVDVPGQNDEIQELQERIQAEHKIQEGKDIDEIIDDEGRY